MYTHPESLEDETIETYFRPLVETRLKKAQVNQYAVSMTNSLTSIREALHQWKGPARMVWGLKDGFSAWNGRNGWSERCRVHAVYEGWKEPTCSFRKRCRS